MSNKLAVTVLGAAARQHVAQDAESRPRSAYGAEHREWAARPGRLCLYCGAPDPEGSEEHVLGVSLGNWWWVIPPDVVCHACNHGRLSGLDEKLGRHPFIALTRTLTNIPGRADQRPEVGASNMRMWRDQDGELQLSQNGVGHARFDGDEVTATVKWTNIGPAQRKETAAALMKVGLGCLWLGRGPDETSQARYDHVRDAVLRRADVPLQYGFGNSDLPNHALMISAISLRSQTGMRVSLNYFGTELWAESAGYLNEAPAAFIAGDTDHLHVQGADAPADSELSEN